MGSTTKVKVSEIFTQAGAAFSRLGELTMQLQTADDGSSKWTDEEIDMLNTSLGRFSSELNEISYRVKSRGVTQLKQTLKKKTFEDAGIPVKQIAIVAASQPSQPVAVAVQPQPPQIQTTHQSSQSTVQHIVNVQHNQSVQSVQHLQQFQQHIIQSAQPQQQQYQFIQHTQPVPILAPIEITEISTDDQTNDSQDDEPSSNIIIEDNTAIETSVTSDQSVRIINDTEVHADVLGATAESAKTDTPEITAAAAAAADPEKMIE